MRPKNSGRDYRIDRINRIKISFLSIQSSILSSCLKIFIGCAALAVVHPSFAGVATFAGSDDEVPLQAEGLTKVEALFNGYQLSGGSTNFTDDCTGPQSDHAAIHDTVISELNPDITDALGLEDWEITLQLHPNSAGIEPGSGQAWGVGLQFGNGTNETTSLNGAGNFARGADLIFGFTESGIDSVTFPMLTPYVFLIGADFSLNPEGDYFNIFHAVDYSFVPTASSFFQDFLGSGGKLILRRTGLDQSSRPIVEIQSELEGRLDTWAWTAFNARNPDSPVVNTDARQVTNVNLNGLIPSESRQPISDESLGMPLTSLYLFVENETTWVQYDDPIFDGSEEGPNNTSDECFGSQPTPEQSTIYTVDFDFPVDDPGEVDSNDAAAFQAMLTGARDDINSYGNVDEQRMLPEGTGRFACLTIESEAIPDINPDSRCPVVLDVAPAWVEYD